MENQQPLPAQSEPKLKLTIPNILGIISIIIALGTTYIQLNATISALTQRVITLEQDKQDEKSDKAKGELKLDKMQEGINQIRIDVAKLNMKYEDK